MKRLRVSSLLGASAIAVAAVTVVGGTVAVNDVIAAGANPGPASARTPSTATVSAVHPAGVGAGKQTLLATYIESGNGDGETLTPEQSTALDGVNKVTCPSGDTCTITATISVQLVDHNKDASNLYCVPWELDGNQAGEQAPFIGETSTDGLLTGDTWTDQQSGVAAGKHTVQSFVFTQKGASLASWTVTYNVYV
jgi:hypothetical protein